MKDYENIVKALKLCASSDPDKCEQCPYNEKCDSLEMDVLAVMERMKAELDKPMPDYSHITKQYDAEVRKLNDKLTAAEISLERAQRELAEEQKELVYLRAVKVTAEAFLGRKIGY